METSEIQDRSLEADAEITLNPDDTHKWTNPVDDEYKHVNLKVGEKFSVSGEYEKDIVTGLPTKKLKVFTVIDHDSSRDYKPTDYKEALEVIFELEEACQLKTDELNTASELIGKLTNALNQSNDVAAVLKAKIKELMQENDKIQRGLNEMVRISAMQNKK